MFADHALLVGLRYMTSPTRKSLTTSFLLLEASVVAYQRMAVIAVHTEYKRRSGFASCEVSNPTLADVQNSGRIAQLRDMVR